jgi:tetratricopeptide (TPR) repeat protein
MEVSAQEWGRLLSWAEQLLRMPEGERASFIASLDLGERLELELRELLRAHGHMVEQAFLESPPPLDFEPRHPAWLSAGMEVGPWRLLRQIGEGGMGVVWLASRADGLLRRQVALKFPHSGPGQEMLVRRLQRECEILSSLEHPGIARLYDVGVTDAGTPYLVIEYVEGQSLIEHADSNRLGIAARLHLFAQVLRALEFAHGKMVLHSDLKPANILVTSAGVVQLLDFGIARLLAAEAAGARPAGSGQTTILGARLMTPGYASPEQLRGERLGVTSDVYSLGVILHELLCARQPARLMRPAPHGTEFAEELPELPSRIAVDAAALQARGASRTSLKRRLQGDLDAIVVKALQPRPEARYPSVQSFAEDVERHLGARPVAARVPGWAYFAGKFMRRHRLGLAVVAASLASLLFAGTFALEQFMHAQAQGRRAVAARDFLLELFADVVPDRRGGAELTPLQLIEEGHKRVLQRLTAQPQLQAELLSGIGETLFAMGDLPSADEALKSAAEVFHAQDDAIGEARARLRRFLVNVDDGRADHVEARLAETAPLARVIQSDPELRLSWAYVKAAEKEHFGRQAEGRDLLAQAIDASTALPASSDVLWKSVLNVVRLAAIVSDEPSVDEWLRRGTELAAHGDPYVRAQRASALAATRAQAALYLGHFQAVRQRAPDEIAACVRSFGTASRLCGDLYLWYLWALLRIGDVQEAARYLPSFEPALRRSSARRQQFQAAYLMARIEAANGHFDDSTEAIAALEALADPNAPEPLAPAGEIPALYTLVEISVRAGDQARARHWLDVAATQSMAGLVGEPKRLALARGLYLQAGGRHADALQSMGDFCDGQAKGIVEALVSMNCIDSLVALGHRAQAEAVGRTALEVVTRLIGPDAPNSMRIRARLEELHRPGKEAWPPWTPERIFMS